MRLFGPSIAAAAATLAASPLGAATFGTSLIANVPIVCKLAFRGEITAQDGGYGLGQLHQYCNSPTGYVVEIDYTPGTLRGTRLQVGDQQTVLDGSGHDEVARAAGPKIADADLSATPAATGFDTNSLSFRITPL